MKQKVIKMCYKKNKLQIKDHTILIDSLDSDRLSKKAYSVFKEIFKRFSNND